MENVYEVSDIVDSRIDKEDALSKYKASLGFDDRTINRNSIEEVKEKIKEKARENIAEKLESNMEIVQVQISKEEYKMK